MFELFSFTSSQIEKYFKAAQHDFQVAEQNNQPDVIFMFSYNGLIKLAITICAKNNLRVKSEQGHHIELIEKLSDFLNDKDIAKVGNEMRKKRNRDLYEGDIIITEKQAQEYFEYLKQIIKLVESLIWTNYA